MNQTVFHLPLSPTERCLDRFSILDQFPTPPDPYGEDDSDDSLDAEDDNGEVSVWRVLGKLLRNTPVANGTQLAGLLETIAITLRGSTGPAGDYGLLKEIVDGPDNKYFGNFFEIGWPKLTSVASLMPFLFRKPTLPVLGTLTDDATPRQTALGPVLESTLVLTREQVACILVHQFLCSLGAPKPRRSEHFDFSVWYSSRQRHPEAAKLYLTTLIKHISELSLWDHDKLPKPSRGNVTYTLRTLFPDQSPQQVDDSLPLSEIKVQHVIQYDTSPASLGVPHGAAVVSANKVIGFGESATQEEIHVGCSPEACPAVLFTPELQHNQVLVIKGAIAVTNIAGQRRGVHFGDQQYTEEDADWSQRTMLFMDALELDMPEQYDTNKNQTVDSAADGGGRHESTSTLLPDLVQWNMDREITKARLAFSSGPYKEIVSPLWGCGVFNGDPFIKVLLLWIAASIASSEHPDGTLPALKIVCDDGLRDIAGELTKMLDLAQLRLKTVGDLRELLNSMPKNVKRLETGQWLIEHLQSL